MEILKLNPSDIYKIVEVGEGDAYFNVASELKDKLITGLTTVTAWSNGYMYCEGQLLPSVVIGKETLHTVAFYRVKLARMIIKEEE